MMLQMALASLPCCDCRPTANVPPCRTTSLRKYGCALRRALNALHTSVAVVPLCCNHLPVVLCVGIDKPTGAATSLQLCAGARWQTLQKWLIALQR